MEILTSLHWGEASMQTGPQGIEEFGEGVESGMVLRVAELVTAIHYLYAESQILGYSLRECAFIE